MGMSLNKEEKWAWEISKTLECFLKGVFTKLGGKMIEHFKTLPVPIGYSQFPVQITRMCILSDRTVKQQNWPQAKSCWDFCLWRPLPFISWSAFWMIVPFSTHSLVCFFCFESILHFPVPNCVCHLLIQLLIQSKSFWVWLFHSSLFVQPPVLVSLVNSEVLFSIPHLNILYTIQPN